MVRTYRSCTFWNNGILDIRIDKCRPSGNTAAVTILHFLFGEWLVWDQFIYSQIFAAFMSGLTMALMSLDSMNLSILEASGSQQTEYWMYLGPDF